MLVHRRLPNRRDEQTRIRGELCDWGWMEPYSGGWNRLLSYN